MARSAFAYSGQSLTSESSVAAPPTAARERLACPNERSLVEPDRGTLGDRRYLLSRRTGSRRLDVLPDIVAPGGFAQIEGRLIKSPETWPTSRALPPGPWTPSRRGQSLSRRPPATIWKMGFSPASTHRLVSAAIRTKTRPCTASAQAGVFVLGRVTRVANKGVSLNW